MSARCKLPEGEQWVYEPKQHGYHRLRRNTRSAVPIQRWEMGIHRAALSVSNRPSLRGGYGSRQEFDQPCSRYTWQHTRATDARTRCGVQELPHSPCPSLEPGRYLLMGMHRALAGRAWLRT